MNALRLLLMVTFILGIDTSQAEPWIANRYAQNCAGCHAPGRLNRKPAKRRCTLSCQGCHVNPNGGGLRNKYGKWNEERWLRSFYTEMAWNKKSPAPLKNQKYYGKHNKKLQEMLAFTSQAKGKRKRGKEKLKGKKPKKGKSKKLSKSKTRGKKTKGKSAIKATAKRLTNEQRLEYAKYGANLIGIDKVIEDETPYFESSNYETAQSQVHELSRIPKNDPYRLERQDMVTVGGDLRFFYLQQSSGAASPKLEKGTFYPMVFDFGVRVRPIKEKLSLVYEGRAINVDLQEPSSLDRLFGPSGTGVTRSAYVLVDDLWYNTYFQYGYYRPMFGLYNPNHTALTTAYTGLGIRARVKAAGFGTAPNVPFGIVNVILPTEGATNSDIASEGGFNVTAGLRFVSFGAHLQASYWDTVNDQGVVPRKRIMWNVNAGGVLFDRRLILNGEITNVRREVAGVDEIKIFGLESRFRVWRQNYVQAFYTQANGAYDSASVSGTGISPGSADEMVFGFRSFVLSGLDLEFLSSTKNNEIEGLGEFKEETISVQMHAYF